MRARIRTLTDGAATGLAILSTILVVAPLVAIFIYLIYKGASSLSWAFFTQVPKPVGEAGGGMANAIAGSAILLGLASLIGVPVGISGGIFLAEYGRGTKLANAIRFTADVLNGVPSIVMGIAAYSLVVVPQGHFSAFSGGGSCSLGFSCFFSSRASPSSSTVRVLPRSFLAWGRNSPPTRMKPT